MVLGKYQSQLSELPTLPEVRYENIFRMYATEQHQYYYNLLKGLYIDGEVDTTKIFYMPVKEFLPWSTISYNAYGTIELWWLIALINNIDNPIKTPAIGTVLKVVRPEYLPQILAEIKNILD
jgi:hypothetical protein